MVLKWNEFIKRTANIAHPVHDDQGQFCFKMTQALTELTGLLRIFKNDRYLDHS
jgi:hypothetical protein